MKASSHLKAHLALLGANLFYGAGFTIAKTVMPRLILPFGFIMIRVGVTALLFWLTFLGGQGFRAKIERRDWPILVLGGLFGVGLNQMLFFYGLNLTTPIHASLIMMSTPLLITLIAAIILKAGMRWDQGLGLLLGIGGAALLMTAGKELVTAPDAWRGDLSIFFNAASYAIYLVIIKPLMQRYRPILVIRWVFFFGLCFVLPFSWPQFAQIPWHLFAWSDYAAVAFIVICCTFFTYLWNIYALRILSPATAGAYIYLQPLFAAVIAMLWLGEVLTWVKLLAAFLIFSG
ncbi:MAG: DMT family transporter, partial [Bacteroidetes bacterium]|nr:DMT family transporter [Bacteroidota bacterium]